jgi:hypothetical protein
MIAIRGTATPMPILAPVDIPALAGATVKGDDDDDDDDDDCEEPSARL